MKLFFKLVFAVLLLFSHLTNSMNTKFDAQIEESISEIDLDPLISLIENALTKYQNLTRKALYKNYKDIIDKIHLPITRLYDSQIELDKDLWSAEQLNAFFKLIFDVFKIDEGREKPKNISSYETTMSYLYNLGAYPKLEHLIAIINSKHLDNFEIYELTKLILTKEPFLINQISTDRQTPIFYVLAKHPNWLARKNKSNIAINVDELDLLKLLLDSGADATVINKSNIDVLRHAIYSCARSRSEMITILMDHLGMDLIANKADLILAEYFNIMLGQSPKPDHIPIFNIYLYNMSEFINYLYKNGVDVSPNNQSFLRLDVLEQFLNLNDYYNRNYYRRNSLKPVIIYLISQIFKNHESFSFNAIKVTELYLKRGHGGGAEAIIEAILDSKKNFNCQFELINENGNIDKITPILYAAYHMTQDSNIKILHAFLACGGDPSKGSYDGKSSIEILASKNQRNLANLLIANTPVENLRNIYSEGLFAPDILNYKNPRFESIKENTKDFKNLLISNIIFGEGSNGELFEFPAEIIDIILSYLDISDLGKFRQLSKSQFIENYDDNEFNHLIEERKNLYKNVLTYRHFLNINKISAEDYEFFYQHIDQVRCDEHVKEEDILKFLFDSYMQHHHFDRMLHSVDIESLVKDVKKQGLGLDDETLIGLVFNYVQTLRKNAQCWENYEMFGIAQPVLAPGRTHQVSLRQ